MDELYTYLTSISTIQNKTWNVVKELVTETNLKKGDYFIEAGVTARKIGFLQDGVIRAFYRNKEGSEYNKQFFTSNNLLGGYSPLVTQSPDKIYLQALTDCRLSTANYDELIVLYDDRPGFQRFGRRLAAMF